ncbi:MAG: phosphatase PAP2 family protein [Actinomycetota bacterium]|nr:phosphatase PAP2 family protein [Actinomycetota bacterium]
MTRGAEQAPLGTLWDRSTHVGRALGAIDDAGDRWSRELRGNRWADAGASVLSNLSDYGVVWVLAAAWKARHAGQERRRAVVALTAAGVTSYVVNRAAKRLAGRSRPDSGDTLREVLPVRSPASSSFPSGHTLAAFCTAAVLPDSLPARRAAFTFAAAVAASRVHLRVHHTSDVLGGAVIGAALGILVRPLVDVAAPRRRRA